jgi:hypothetical protein
MLRIHNNAFGIRYCTIQSLLIWQHLKIYRNGGPVTRLTFKLPSSPRCIIPIYFPMGTPSEILHSLLTLPNTQYGYPSTQVKGGDIPFGYPVRATHPHKLREDFLPDTQYGYPSTQVKGGGIPSGYPVRLPIHTS